MAGHSHWAGTKHKKGRVDKQRSKIFSKLSKEISVAAKLGSKDPTMNARLRSAIQSAKIANMPKENIKRAIDKFDMDNNLNYENLRYEGFGPENIAVIVETLTDNKNRTASNIRTIFQKFGGSFGTTGVASHQFKHVGVIRIEKNKILEDKMFEIAINAGAEDCLIDKIYYEIITKKDNFYKVKSKIETTISDIAYSGIEWQPINKVNLNQEKIENINDFLVALEENDDVQNVFVNFEIKDKDINQYIPK